MFDTVFPVSITGGIITSSLKITPPQVARSMTLWQYSRVHPRLKANTSGINLQRLDAWTVTEIGSWQRERWD